MPYNLTFTIIKPDAVLHNRIGKILSAITDNGFSIRALKMLELSEDIAGDFYAEHKGRPYFGDLIEFMTSGPVVVAVLGAEDAVSKYRALMGATKTIERLPGTLRFKYGTTLMHNALHGSDSEASAEREIEFFFKGIEIF